MHKSTSHSYFVGGLSMVLGHLGAVLGSLFQSRLKLPTSRLRLTDAEKIICTKNIQIGSATERCLTLFL